METFDILEISRPAAFIVLPVVVIYMLFLARKIFKNIQERRKASLEARKEADERKRAQELENQRRIEKIAKDAEHAKAESEKSFFRR